MGSIWSDCNIRNYSAFRVRISDDNDSSKVEVIEPYEPFKSIRVVSSTLYSLTVTLQDFNISLLGQYYNKVAKIKFNGGGNVYDVNPHFNVKLTRGTNSTIVMNSGVMPTSDYYNIKITNKLPSFISKMNHVNLLCEKKGNDDVLSQIMLYLKEELSDEARYLLNYKKSLIHKDVAKKLVEDSWGMDDIDNIRSTLGTAKDHMKDAKVSDEYNEHLHEMISIKSNGDNAKHLGELEEMRGDEVGDNTKAKEKYNAAREKYKEAIRLYTEGMKHDKRFESKLDKVNDLKTRVDKIARLG